MANTNDSAPILKIADLDEGLFVCIDAYKEGLGGVLTKMGMSFVMNQGISNNMK
jgi:hypothetical protein